MSLPSHVRVRSKRARQVNGGRAPRETEGWRSYAVGANCLVWCEPQKCVSRWLRRALAVLGDQASAALISAAGKYVAVSVGSRPPLDMCVLSAPG